MHKQIKIVIVAVALGFSMSACVSTATFDKMEADKNQEIKSLKIEQSILEELKAELERQRLALGQQKRTLESDQTALMQQNAANEQMSSVMQARVGTLEQQKAVLLAASQQRQQQYEALVQKLSKEVESGQLQVRQYQNMLSVDLAEQIFFDSGRATLKRGGKDVLKTVGEALKSYDNKIIRVVGHTDNVKIAKSLQKIFPTNWELSVARATTVVRFLQDVGIPPESLVASGRGEYEPIASNDTEAGRKQNRRIEIMLIDKSLANEMEKSIK